MVEELDRRQSEHGLALFQKIDCPECFRVDFPYVTLFNEAMTWYFRACSGRRSLIDG
jgi:hypothetical protein